MGSTPTDYNFTVSATQLSLNLIATALPQPVLSANSVANAASFETGKPIAHGSDISIFGSNLSNATSSASTTTLPLATDYVGVSLDVPAAHLRVPDI